jgi:uncharacterized SAM-binding protein YcdF (DUF218 family)
MTVAKALVAALVLPLVTAAVLLLFALALRLSRFRRLAAAAAALALAVAYGGSIPLVGQALLRPLEQRYPPLTTAPAADTVVVLGSSYSPQPGISVAAGLDNAGLVRILSGIDWAKTLGSRLVVSGGAPRDGAPSAQGYAALATDLGIPPERIVMLDEPLDTGDEALAVAALLESRPFVLVTSAYHMPRAVELMERAGARPIPAPTDQQVAVDQSLQWSYFVPQASALQNSEEALHEYVGLLAIAAGLD